MDSPTAKSRCPEQSTCAMRFLRRIFRSGARTPLIARKASTKLKVLIWGRGNGSRSLKNQQEIVEDLHAAVDKLNKHIDVVSLNDPTTQQLEQQLSLLWNTSILISPHGAGLALMPALSPGSSIIELYGKEYMSYRLYHNIASMLDMHHTWIECDAVKDDTSFFPKKYTFGTPTYRDSPMQCNSPDIILEVMKILRSK
eukprot:m.198735 g.198735  ORF g.198735 m.198735 type:complete len:198 (-) comp18759_c0_seq1:218-811(-)